MGILAVFLWIAGIFLGVNGFVDMNITMIAGSFVAFWLASRIRLTE